jgi:hypothetical protein
LEISDSKFLENEDYKKPYSMFELMSSAELQDLEKDIEMYQNIDKKNQVF